MPKSKGFTLIELMIALVVIAILAAIAVPAYRDSVIKGNRRAAQTAVLDLANLQQQFFVSNRAYGSAAALGYTLPPEVATHYDLAITVNNAATPPTFLLTLTPKGGQAKDGALTVNSAGRRTPDNKW